MVDDEQPGTPSENCISDKNESSTSEAQSPVIQRREFLRLLSHGVAGVATGGLAATLSGCGGGSGSGLQNGGIQSADNSAGLLSASGSSLATVTTRFSTRSATGTVNTTHIGGTGLRVQSAHKPVSAVGTDKKFTTLVSAQGAQLLFVTDSQRAVRGATIANPAVAAPIVCDATSTALSLIMVTPGILETNSAKAAQRMAEIKAYRSFPPLVAFLTQYLKTTSLTALRRSPQLNALKNAVINEYRALHGGLRSNVIERASVMPRVENGLSAFSADFLTGLATVQPVKLSHRGWRIVRVDRQLLDAQGRQLELTRPVTNSDNKKLDTMNGATPASWGSMLVFGVGNPTEDKDIVNLLTPIGTPPARAVTVRYTISGIGHAVGSDVPSFWSVADIAAAAGQTIVWALLLPVLDFVIGAAGMLEKSRLLVDIAWNSLQTVLNTSGFTTSIISAAKSGDAPGAAAAAVDFFTAMLPIVKPLLELIQTAARASTVGEIIGLGQLIAGAEVLALIGPFISIANAAWAAGTWLGYPMVSKVELPVSGATVVIR